MKTCFCDACIKLRSSCLMMMMMMNCFCGMVDQRKAFSLISSRDHCQRSSPSRISDTPGAGFEPAQNLSSGLVEWVCAVVITTTPRRHFVSWITYDHLHMAFATEGAILRRSYINLAWVGFKPTAIEFHSDAQGQLRTATLISYFVQCLGFTWAITFVSCMLIDIE